MLRCEKCNLVNICNFSEMLKIVIVTNKTAPYGVVDLFFFGGWDGLGNGRVSAGFLHFYLTHLYF